MSESLYKCKDCGRNISSFAEKCPGCGGESQNVLMAPEEKYRFGQDFLYTIKIMTISPFIEGGFERVLYIVGLILIFVDSEFGTNWKRLIVGFILVRIGIYLIELWNRR